MVNGLIVQKLAVEEKRLVLDLRLQKHPTEERNVTERLQIQLLALEMLVEVTSIYTT